MNDKEFLSLARKNPGIWCDSNNLVRPYKVVLKSLTSLLTSLKLKPKTLEFISSIQKKCSPSAIRGKLKKLGRYNSNRYSKPLTEKMKVSLRGDKRKFGKIVKGYVKKSSWIYNTENKFSDPLNHQAGDFQYLVHMIRGTHSVGTHEYAFNQGKRYLNSLTKTSLSLVNQNDLITFGVSIGLLVWMNPQNLWATHLYNMSSDHLDLADLNGSFPIYTPEELFKQRKPFGKRNKNNEIVALKGTDIIGYFLITNPATNKVWWEYYEPENLEVLEKACVKQNLPVLILPYNFPK